jgi:hypothetical protein
MPKGYVALNPQREARGHVAQRQSFGAHVVSTLCQIEQCPQCVYDACLEGINTR